MVNSDDDYTNECNTSRNSNGCQGIAEKKGIATL